MEVLRATFVPNALILDRARQKTPNVFWCTGSWSNEDATGLKWVDDDDVEWVLFFLFCNFEWEWGFLRRELGDVFLFWFQRGGRLKVRDRAC